jgi:hypothetical protein
LHGQLPGKLTVASECCAKPDLPLSFLVETAKGITLHRTMKLIGLRVKSSMGSASGQSFNLGTETLLQNHFHRSHVIA